MPDLKAKCMGDVWMFGGAPLEVVSPNETIVATRCPLLLASDEGAESMPRYTGAPPTDIYLLPRPPDWGSLAKHLQGRGLDPAPPPVLFAAEKARTSFLSAFSFVAIWREQQQEFFSAFYIALGSRRVVVGKGWHMLDTIEHATRREFHVMGLPPPLVELDFDGSS